MDSTGLCDLYHCPIDGRTVLFDLPGDRYLLVPDRLQAEFDAWLLEEGVPPPGFLKPVLAVVAGSSGLRPQRAISVPPVVRALERGRVFLPARWRAAWGWYRAAAQVRRDLARSGLAAMLARTQAEKRAIHDPRDPLPVARQLRAAQGHRAIAGDCLVQSLTLMHALHARRSTATLVLGVTLDPFRAHSWVQHRDHVLNDEVDAVAPYRPILTL